MSEEILLYNMDYITILNFFINKFDYCRIVDASINPQKYGMTLGEVIDLGTEIYFHLQECA